MYAVPLGGHALNPYDASSVTYPENNGAGADVGAAVARAAASAPGGAAPPDGVSDCDPDPPQALSVIASSRGNAKLRLVRINVSSVGPCEIKGLESAVQPAFQKPRGDY